MSFRKCIGLSKTEHLFRFFVYNNMKLYLFGITILLACSCSGQVNDDNVYNGRALPENICRVVKDGATERPFTGEFWNHKEEGVYICVACDNPLFTSDHKYASGSGWPSYYDVLNDGNVLKKDDYSLGMRRIEIQCSSCKAHLGHLFNDGPKPTGMRYCVNSASLKFKAKKK